jgi:multicomponent Na+:H+ antiporter subunit G
MNLAVDATSWILMSVGGVFVFVGGLGVLRMPDLYTRMHAAGLTDSLGSIFVLSGAMLQAGVSLAAVKLAAIIVFLLLTCPTASYALANAARLSVAKARGSDSIARTDNDA